MKNIYFLTLILISTLKLSAQDIKNSLYKGTLNNQSITLYLKQQPNPCGGGTLPLYEGIYQYASGKNWIELSVSNNAKENLCLAEVNFTGVLILKKTVNGMEGIWISPDAKTQHKVVLKKQPLTPKQKEEMEVNLERTHYENNDC